LNIQYFNIIEAAKILGINVSSIKRWTDEGKLECIKTAGGHRKFMLNHIAAFLEKNKKKTTKANIFPIEDSKDIEVSFYILKQDFAYLKDYILEQALNCNRYKVHQVINGLYLSQIPLYKIYDHLVTPALHDLGSMWENDKISVIEEYFSTQTIKDSLIRFQGIINVPKNKIGKVICMNLSNELHDIALKMIDHILEEQGYQIYFSGQMTPFIKTQQIFEKVKPVRLYISSTIVPDRKTIQDELNSILDLAEIHKIKVFVGGSGFDMLNFDHPAVVRRLVSMEEVFESGKQETTEVA